MKASGIISLLLFCLVCKSQTERNGRIQDFSIQAASTNQVLVSWSVGAGSTCNSPQVQHSLDGVNFKTVYTYPGVCGGTEETEYYSWVHTSAKAYALNFYRVKLDEFDFTEALKLDLNAKLAGTNFVLYPNPTSGMVSFEFRNEQRENFYLEVLNVYGQVVMQSEKQLSSTGALDLSSKEKGLYFFLIRNRTNVVYVKRLILN